MAEYRLTNKAVENLSKIWEYTFEVGQKIKLTNITMNTSLLVKKLLKTQIQGKSTREYQSNFSE